MSSLSASHAVTRVHVVRTATVRAAMSAEVTAVHAARTEVREVRVARDLPMLLQQSRTTNLKCSDEGDA